MPVATLGARRLARKPGPSCGLLGDADGGLLYFLLEGRAVMRWDPRRGAGSRGHELVYQDNATLPLSSALFLDGRGAAWAACTTFADHSLAVADSAAAAAGPKERRPGPRPTPHIRQRASNRNPRPRPRAGT